MTVGFIFNWDLDEVLLIRKNRPVWQSGLLNGIGGHFEEPDKGDAIECWLREVREECGLVLPYREVVEVGTINVIQNRFDGESPVTVNILAFRQLKPEDRELAHPKTDESIVWLSISGLYGAGMISNLLYLIPFARDFFASNSLLPHSHITLNYK